MDSEDLQKIRRDVLAEVSGVVLEIGIGPGYNLPLYKNVEKLYALEPSKELIEIAKARAVALSFQIEFLNSEGEHIPLPDHSIDTVVSTWTMCSVKDPKKVLAEIARVLRPQGMFVFVDHGAAPNVGLRVLQKLFTFFTKYFTGNCHYDRKLDVLIKEAGFTVIQMTHPRERRVSLTYNFQGIASLAQQGTDEKDR